MSYYVTREGQTYGPYTLDDLQRYVSSGNVLLTDMAKTDDAAEWIPVAQILGVASSADAATAPPPPSVPSAPSPFAPVANPYGAPVPTYGAPAIPYPDPPNLHWAIVLLICFFCGFFGFIWEIVQLSWLRKVQPQTKAIRYFILAYAIGFVGAGFFTTIGQFGGSSSHLNPFFLFGCGAIGLVAAIFYFLYRFAMRESIEQYYNTVEPIGLRLGPIMTFLFGSLYFQYHFTRINEMKRAARLGYRP